MRESGCMSICREKLRKGAKKRWFEKGESASDLQMGKTFSSVQLTSMLPLGHPVPPETTFTILNAGGGVERFCGRAEATATTAATERTNFILEYLIFKKKSSR
jgi:hypothetical protein